VKMRRSKHSIDMCSYEVTSKGLEIGKPMRGYRALTSGIPSPWSLESVQNEPGLQTTTPTEDRPRKESPGKKNPRKKKSRKKKIAEDRAR